ncbi:hypothetical protein OG21DRAFT_1513217 [Imleria badia]|nr:hypothetical protein OG21DRAFT_1513217 [Imleria badia]
MERDSSSSTTSADPGNSTAFQRWLKKAAVLTGIGVTPEERQRGFEDEQHVRCQNTRPPSPQRALVHRNHAPGGLDDPLLAPLINVFPCTFILGSFKAKRAYLEGLRNGYDRVRLAGYLAPIVDALVMGGA